MEAAEQRLDELFRSLAADPRSLAAFDSYARAVEAAADRSRPEVDRALAATLARHLGLLPHLAESRLVEVIDRVSRSLLGSVDLTELRPGQELASAYEAARKALLDRFPHAEGLGPEEFVHRHRRHPSRIVDWLEGAAPDWAAPRLTRCRSILRKTAEVPGDPSLDPVLAGALAEVGEALEDIPPASLAAVSYRGALLFDPGQPSARAGLGRIAHRYGRLAEAELEFKAALDRDPGRGSALFGLGVIALRRGRVAEAEVLAARLGQTQAIGSDAPLLAGACALLKGRHAEALGQLIAALRLDPDRALTCELLSRAYAATGHRELAAAHHEAARRRRDPLSRPPPTLPIASRVEALPDRLLEPPPELPPGTSGEAPRARSADPVPTPDLGPLTRREAFRRLLVRCLDKGEVRSLDLGPVLKARVPLRISKEDFESILEEARGMDGRAREAGPLDPIEYFEELRAVAWRDGYLGPDEREILDQLSRALGIDRRARGRKKPD